MASNVTSAPTMKTDWTLIWAQRPFRYFFFAMFISLFGSGMNFAGVGWYIFAATHSAVKVSWQVIFAMAPGLLVPFIGGVLIDRFDRRYLGVLLDLLRGAAVLATAYIAWSGHLHLWHLFAITFVTGAGSAMYWANVNSLVQEVMPPSQFTGANAAVLIGVQTGMLFAGAFVGFVYDRAGIAGILGIDGLTYFVSAWCLFNMRRGYVSPREHLAKYPHEYSEATDATATALETGEIPDIAEAGLSLSVYSDLKQGFADLKSRPVVRVLGVTHSILMGGIVSANVLIILLAGEVLNYGAKGLGYLEGGWGLGALLGGLFVSQLPQRLRLTLYGLAMAGLAIGHVLMPLIPFLIAAVFFQILFGFFRALSGVISQATLMAIVPRHFMGRTQSAIAVLTTIFQLLMSFALGWVSHQFSLLAGFCLLALMYVVGTLSAFRARQLLQAPEV